MKLGPRRPLPPRLGAARVLPGPVLSMHGVVFAILCPGPAVHRARRVEHARERAYGALRRVWTRDWLVLRAYGQSPEIEVGGTPIPSHNYPMPKRRGLRKIVHWLSQLRRW